MSSETTFFKYIFNDDTKYSILNLMQLSFIALIPLYLLVKLLDILPEANEKKGFLETFFEIILHIIILIIGIVIIVKFSMYFKPMSGIPYPEDFAFMPMILVSLFIGITYQTKLSEKIFTLKEKIMNKVKPEKPAPPVQNNTLTHFITDTGLEDANYLELVNGTIKLLNSKNLELNNFYEPSSASNVSNSSASNVSNSLENKSLNIEKLLFPLDKHGKFLKTENLRKKESSFLPKKEKK